MVKNEDDIIEESLRNLISQGVNRIVVADNGSSDRTAEVVGRIAAELPVYLVRDPLLEYWQGDKMSHLARAATRNGASWIVPFDADELWKGTEGRSLAEVLRSSDANVMAADWWDFAPIDSGVGSGYGERFVMRHAAKRDQIKVAYRANWLARSTVGNHAVSRPCIKQSDGLRIAHYRTRSPEQVLRKALDGAAAANAAGWRTSTLPQWFGISDPAAAAAAISGLTSDVDLVVDPSHLW